MADLAKSKQNTSKVVFLPSAIDFFIQPTEDEHRQVFLEWKDNFITTINEFESLSHPCYISGNQHMQTILELCYETKKKN